MHSVCLLDLQLDTLEYLIPVDSVWLQFDGGQPEAV